MPSNLTIASSSYTNFALSTVGSVQPATFFRPCRRYSFSLFRSSLYTADRGV